MLKATSRYVGILAICISQAFSSVLIAQDEYKSLKCRFAEEKLKTYFALYNEGDYPAIDYLHTLYAYCPDRSPDSELIYTYFLSIIRDQQERNVYGDGHWEYDRLYVKMDSLYGLITQEAFYDIDFISKFEEKFNRLYKPVMAMGFRSAGFIETRPREQVEKPVQDIIFSEPGMVISNRLRRPSINPSYVPEYDEWRGNSRENLPSFPIPPNDFSAETVLSYSWFSQIQNLGELEEVIYTALSKEDYDGHMRHFGVPGGFAIITNPEQIKSNKKPQSDYRRWKADPGEFRNRGFDIFPYVNSIETSGEGKYRMFAFLVSKDPFPYYPDRMSMDEKRAWDREGNYGMLPDLIARQMYSSSHKVVVLVYEFEFEGNGSPPRLLKLEEEDAVRQHLRASGLWESLQN